MAELGTTNVKTARDEEMAAAIADLVGLTERTVQKRLDAHGRTLVRNLFEDRWPARAEDFEGKTSAWVRDAGLFEELAAITGLTVRTVRGRLQNAHGKTHVPKVFADDWPDGEADAPGRGSRQRTATGPQKAGDGTNDRQIERARASNGQGAGSMGDTKKKRTKGARSNGAGSNGGKSNGATERTGSLGFETKLWDAADLLRDNMDPAEYKHVVLGLLFLKYIEDAFEKRREELEAAVADPHSDEFVEPDEREAVLADLLEDRDEYTADNVFWVPEKTRWSHLRAEAPQATIGKTLDDAMDAIERENPRLKGVLPKVYAQPNRDKHALGKLIDLVSGIGLGTKEHKDKDTLGRVYEYFLSRFASSEGRGGGKFYTPTSVVRLLVEMLEPYRGRVYDPCCGSGGMFVQSLNFIEAHDGRGNQITVYGQESNRTTWRMAQMNLAIRALTHLGAFGASPYTLALPEQAFVARDGGEAWSTLEHAVRDVVGARLDTTHRSTEMEPHPWRSVMCVLLRLVEHNDAKLGELPAVPTGSTEGRKRFMGAMAALNKAAGIAFTSRAPATSGTR